MQALIIKEDEWVKRKDVVMVMFDVLGKTDKVMTLDIFKELSDRLDEIGGVHFIPKKEGE